MISFANPAFLWTLPLLGVPIVLHMMQRQVPKSINFPSIRFIKKASDSQQGRKGLRDLVTLLTRLLILAAMILFFAKPRFEETVATARQLTGKQVVIIVDTSASMSAGDLKGFLKRALDDLEEQYPESQCVVLISANGLVDEFASNDGINGVRGMLLAQNAGVMKGDHDAALAKAGEMAALAPEQSVCVVISDFQGTDWQQKALAHLQATCDTQFLKLPTGLAENVAVIDADYGYFIRKGDRILQVTARLKNISVAEKAVTVVMTQAGQDVSRDVVLAGGESQRVNLELPAAQDYRVSLSLKADDGYELDNQFWLWAGPIPPVPVALLKSNRQSVELERFFLEKALKLKQNGRVEVAWNENGRALLSAGQLEKAAVLIALDSFGVSTDLDVVKAWVEKGGRLIYFAGLESLNSIANLNAAGICGTRALTLHGDRAQLETYYIDDYANDDPMLEPFSKEASDLTQFPIFRYLDLQPDKTSETLISLQNTKPFLVRERLGLGEVYLFAIGALPAWSEFPTSRSFLPIMRQLVEVGVGDSRRGSIQRTCGESLSEGLMKQGLAADVVYKPGITPVQQTAVVVNVDRAESNPIQIDTDELGGSRKKTVDDLQVTESFTASGKDLTAYLAALALVGVLLELIAANFRHSKKRS